ncbi:MAG: M20/M25/M40 family metallo-hydrolase [Proteobacteria bacterium]|nr:M20/M25/M40 family metallo-hydrolase [Pseudomonadota bacterium]
MEEVVALLTELIAFKSTASRPDEIEQCIEYIENYLQQHGIDYTRYDQSGVPSLLVTAQNKSAPVILMSHIDVVEAPDDLFEARRLNGCLYGRGAIDDKYAAALSLVLLKNHMAKLRSAGLTQQDLPFGILITSDEESGGFNGADLVLKDIKTDFCIALDGGSPERIITKEKGVILARIKARGKSAHGARPWLGVNAIDILIDDIVKIRSLFNEANDQRWHRTLNVGIIRAGESSNQVPDVAEASLDIRYTENEDPEELKASIKKMIQSDLTLETEGDVFFSGESKHLDLLLEIAQEAKTDFEHGSSDARFLKKYGIPGIVWGANGNYKQHSAEEHVEIASIDRVYNVLDQFVIQAQQKIK